MSWLAGVLVCAFGVLICVGFRFRDTRLGGYFNLFMTGLMIWALWHIAIRHGGSGLFNPPQGG